MATWSQRVTDTANDGGVYTGTWFNTTVDLGSTSAVAFVRFTGVTVPGSATVTSATLTMWARSSGAGNLMPYTVKGVKVLNPGALSAASSGLTQTTASATSAAGVASTAWPVDVTSIVQEIRAQSGWASGNAVALRLSVATASALMADYSGDSAHAALLTIVYTDPPALCQVTAGVAVKATTVTARVSAGVVAGGVSVRAGVVVTAPDVGVINATGRIQVAATLVAGRASNVDVAPARVAVGATLVTGRVSAETVTGRVTVGASVHLGAPALAPLVPQAVLVGSEAYRAWLTQPMRETTVRVEMIDDNENVVAVFGEDGQRGVAAASITVDANAAVRMSGSVQFTDERLVPRGPHDLLHPLSMLRCRIWQRLKVAGLWQEILMGTIHLDAPQVADDGDSFSITCAGEDSFAVIKRAAWDATLTVGGMKCHEAIEAILDDRAPWVTHAITPTSSVLPVEYELGRPGGDPVEDMLTIADAAGLSLYVDRWGVVVGRPRNKPRPVVAQLIEGDGCMMTGVTRDLSIEDLVNVVTVASSSNEVEPPVSARIQNSDVTSPSSVAATGRKFTTLVQSDAVTTRAQCVSLAQSILADRTAWQETVRVTARSYPHLDPFDLVDVVRNRAGVTGTFEVRACAWDVSNTATMTLEMAQRRLAL